MMHYKRKKSVLTFEVCLPWKYFKYLVPRNSTHTNKYKSCFPILPFVSVVNDFTMSYGYCFSVIEYLGFIGPKTLQEHNMNKYITIKPLSELKLDKQKQWDLCMNYTMLFHSTTPITPNNKKIKTHPLSLVLSPHDYYPANSFY